MSLNNRQSSTIHNLPPSATRVNWIDDVKVMAIYLVILAHTPLCKPLQDWIYVFHMPVFFFLSGYLFSPSRHPSFGDFAWLRFRQLIIPYVGINVVAYLFWLLVGRHVGAGVDTVAWWSPLMAALLGNGPGMIHDVPLWFFLCLYLVELVHHALFVGSRHPWWLVVGFAVLGFGVSAWCPVVLPFSMGTMLVAIVFYAMGNQLQGRIPQDWLTALLCLVGTVVVAFFNGRVNMHANYYGNPALFLAGACCGIYVMVYAGRLIDRHLGCRRILTYVARNTLTICGFHLLAFAFLKGVMVYVLRVRLSVLDGGVLLNAVFALAGLLLCLPVAWAVNRWLPWMAGRT